MNLLDKLFKTLGAPIYHFPIYFFFLLCVLIIYPLFHYFSYSFGFIVCIINTELVFAVIACILILCSHKINKYVYYTTVGIIHFIFYGIAIVDAFVSKNFGCHINSFILQLINNTDVKKTNEFFSTYIVDLHNILLLFVYVILGMIELLCIKKWKSIGITDSLSNYKINKKSFVIFPKLCSLIVVYSFFTLVSIIDASTLGRFQRLDRITNIYASVCFNSIVSVSQFASETPLFELCAEAQANLSIDSCSYNSRNIVLIIGESYNRRHSSLYGYELKTNPKLESLSDNIFIFDNVISPANVTYIALRYFLSFSNVDSKEMWYQTPLFPCAFKDVGYNVSFWSNQFVKSVDMNYGDALCGYFYHPLIEKKMYNLCNKVRFEYDEQLLDSYKSQIDSVFIRTQPNLSIIHLRGQHVTYADRFPKNRTKFCIDDYMYRNELNTKEKQQVADYDNATLYNDSILYEIINIYKDEDAIVVYFPDHGDDVNDYNSHVGRTHIFDENAAASAHCQFDIPFIVYVTESYKANHPDIVEKIRNSTHRPFVIDDLPHLLYDLGGIRSRWYDPRRSLINDSFDTNRKRMVRTVGYKESLDYDSICSGQEDWKIGWMR